MKNKVFLKIIKYIASLGFAFAILYLLFKNQDPIDLVEKIQTVNGKWVVLSMVFGGWAYVSRGIRWIVLIDALNYKSSYLNSISAVGVGYFTNLFFPRAGEISRCTVLNRAEKIPVDKLFGTILVERVIDFIFLFTLFLLILILKFNAIFDFFSAIGERQTKSTFNQNLILLFLMIVLFILIFILIKKWIKSSVFYTKVLAFILGLKEGFRSIKNMKRKFTFWFHTFMIWVMYFLMTYVSFFCMGETAHLTPIDGLFILVLGGIGMVIPTPGGIGSYHAIVMIGLSVLGVGNIFLGKGGDPSNPALLFPTIVHAAQTLVAIIMGLLGLLVLFLSKKKNHVAS